MSTQPVTFKDKVAAADPASAARFNALQDSLDLHLRNLLAAAAKARWVAGWIPSIASATIAVTHDGSDAWADGKRLSSPHKVQDTANVVAAANASDQTTLNTLLNEIKADYNLHRASTTYHQAADATNVVSASDATTLATSLALVKEIKQDFNAHRHNASAHFVVDGGNEASSPAPNQLLDGSSDVITAEMTLAQAITLANELKTDYNAHLAAEIIAAHDFTGAPNDTYYVYIDPDLAPPALAKSTAVPANDKILLCSVVWTSPTLSSLTDLTVASIHNDIAHLATELRLGTLASFSRDLSNAGTPEAVVTAGIGSICRDRTNGDVYLKESGTGNTGWVRITTATSNEIAMLLEGWWQDNVAASQTAVILTRFGAGTGFPTKAIMLRAGSITGIQVKSNAARTAGTLTVEVYRGGVATGLTAVLDGTNTTQKSTTQATGLDTFVAGDELDIRITTDGSWAPTTADIFASLDVHVNP
jgi:hypothetical protein